MEEIINRIISIENKARDVLDSTNAEKEQKHQEMLTKIDRLKEKILHDANNKVQQLRQREIDEAGKKAEDYIAKSKIRFDKMKIYAENNKDKWRDELVKTVLER